MPIFVRWHSPFLHIMVKDDEEISYPMQFLFIYESVRFVRISLFTRKKCIFMNERMGKVGKMQITEKQNCFILYALTTQMQKTHY